ncbi:hypothetical protein BDQ17DRAFT_1354161 [Cyathus striatus]|nr:hypothetical protein BDQ17DRAFT_1354161 [Cyathus striatus]
MTQVVILAFLTLQLGQLAPHTHWKTNSDQTIHDHPLLHLVRTWVKRHRTISKHSFVFRLLYLPEFFVDVIVTIISKRLASK